MFLHMGNTRIVFQKYIIDIFNLNLRDNPINKQFIESTLSKHFLRDRDFDNYKSFIVTEENIHFSAIAPNTLAKRGYSEK